MAEKVRGEASAVIFSLDYSVFLKIQSDICPWRKKVVPFTQPFTGTKTLRGKSLVRKTDDLIPITHVRKY